MKKQGIWITILVILAVGVIAYFGILTGTTKAPIVPESIAQCIGNNSLLYSQLGCSHCVEQENLFGDSFKYINSIDCFYFPEKCQNVTGTPTWLIKGEYYVGVQQIATLQNLTGCK